MKRFSLTIISLSIAICSFGQTSVRDVLREIETNSPLLKAATAEMDAERLAGKAETLLANP